MMCDMPICCYGNRESNMTHRQALVQAFETIDELFKIVEEANCDEIYQRKMIIRLGLMKGILEAYPADTNDHGNMIPPDILKLSINEFDEVPCPHCKRDEYNGNYLHHFKVEVFDRAEDADITKVTSITVNDHYSACLGVIPSNKIDVVSHDGQKFELTEGIPDTKVKQCSSDESNNPSLRRGGINIWFICELCQYISVLTIAQHKGKSLVRWVIKGQATHPEDLNQQVSEHTDDQVDF